MSRTPHAFLATAFVAGLIIATPAQAQTQCGPRDGVVDRLKEKYGETRKSVGLQQGRGIIEVYASDKTGSWTIMVTDPRGIACLMAAGEHWQDIKPEPPGDPT